MEIYVNYLPLYWKKSETNFNIFQTLVYYVFDYVISIFK